MELQTETVVSMVTLFKMYCTGDRNMTSGAVEGEVCDADSEMSSNLKNLPNKVLL